MPISLSGLDMSWLKNPENRLPEQKRKRERLPSKRSDLPAPRVMGDINSNYAAGGFKSPIDGTWIDSRTSLRAHEQRHGVKQCGELTAQQQIEPIKRSYEQSRAEMASQEGIDFSWTD
jgi:hypothetical protein